MDELKQNAIIMNIEMKVCLKYESKFFGFFPKSNSLTTNVPTIINKNGIITAR